MTAELGFAVVGCGMIGGHHAQVITGGAGMRLAALVDVEEERATKLADRVAAEFGASRPAVSTSLAEVLARPDVDAVAVCVPSGLHAEIAVVALEAGKHTVIEKPIDVGLAAAGRIASAADAAGVVTAVISQHRFDPASQVVRRAIDAGRFGQLTSAVASLSWWRGQGYYDSGDWRGTWALDGGGALMNQGVHTLDLLLWFLGTPVDVHATTALLAHERVEVEDTVAATIRFESGALATLHATTAAFPGVSARLQVHGTRGSAVIDNDELVYFHAATGDDVDDYGSAGSGNQAAEELAGVPDGGLDLASAQSRQYADVLAAIAEGRAPLVGVPEATLALATVRAVYESAAAGSTVRVADVR
ncbi:Gfo/Idh/MocA family protein [Pseudonocardia sp. TRM90224]|uniref:Gfo/Idh/MocA family protein n=1 Tax=Pseudonocardia sp. TRM90224 TaxID=2812678 RepID=UPI001E358685|nr:Gfo/Idh/MocA family oxidoreductase [Pseudonocardia sp. TRM90224]